MEKLLARKGRKLDACFILDMPSNDPKFKVYKTLSADEFTKLAKEMQTRLDNIKSDILGMRVSGERDYAGTGFSCSRPVNFLLERLVALGMTMVQVCGANNYFYMDEKCNGCGACQKACLSGKIKMIDKKPVWQREIKCYFCCACINYCPREAIQIKSKLYMRSFTQYNRRYPHPYATLEEISQQKAGRL